MNITKSIHLASVSMLFAVGLAACDKPGPAEEAGRSIDQAAEKVGDKMDEASNKLRGQSNTAGDTLDDTAITAKIKAAILAESGLSVLQINVDTIGGVTTLTGSVDSQQSRDKAKDIARGVAGVKEVENKLIVK